MATSRKHLTKHKNFQYNVNKHIEQQHQRLLNVNRDVKVQWSILNKCVTDSEKRNSHYKPPIGLLNNYVTVYTDFNTYYIKNNRKFTVKNITKLNKFIRDLNNLAEQICIDNNIYINSF